MSKPTRYVTSAECQHLNVNPRHCADCLSLLDRPVSQDSRELARDAAQKVVNIAKHDRMQVPHRDTIAAIFATALQSHADAARPKVSEDDQKAAEELANKLWIRRYELGEMVDAIASDRASVRDAARMAERQRILSAVYALFECPPERLDYSYNSALDDVRKIVDGQPVDGGGE